MKIEILYFSGCPNHLPAVRQVREVLASEGTSAEIMEVEVKNIQTAKRLGFLGSPSIRINGLDIEHTARASGKIGWMCRTYVHHGEQVGVPPIAWIRKAIQEAREG